jgi:hypothetical protein
VTDAVAPQLEPLARLAESVADASIRTVVLVEGRSDQAAVEAVAERCGLDPAASGFLVAPMQGASNLGRFLDFLGSIDLRVLVLGDAAEAPGMHRCLAGAGVPESALYVCVPDLEAELIAALGADRVQELVVEHGDGRAFRSLQRQPEWRDRPLEDQLRRFFGSGSGRKLRYARVLAGQLTRERMPKPLRDVVRTLEN